jgi:hypothetical protein
MRRNHIKHIIIVAGILLVSVFIYVQIQILRMYSLNFQTVSKSYLFLFKDSVKNNVDTTCCNSWTSDKDILNHFLFYENLKNKKTYYEPTDTNYHNYYFVIWDFKQLKNESLDNVIINKPRIIDSIISFKKFDVYNNIIRGSNDFLWKTTLDSKGYCPISIKYKYKFDGLILNVSDKSIIKREFNNTHYKGFYGLIDWMSINNKKGEPQIYFNFEKQKTPTIVLIYKGGNGFYLIMINSNKGVDEKIIDILNLS